MGLLEQVFNAGIIGAGGAGFPTHKKLEAEGVHTLVVNAAECEPLLASDRYVMRHFAKEIIQGLKAVQAHCQIPRVVIGTKKKYTKEIAALRKALSAEQADMEIFEISGFYPAGDEQSLIFEITGETVPPGGIPLHLGIVVLNVSTAMNICLALSDKPVTHKFLTVTGEVGQAVIVQAPVGTLLTDCIAAANGERVTPYAVIKGGPMMGPRFSMEQASRVHIGKQDGGIIVLEKNHPAITFGQKPIEHMINQAKSVCIQCSYCTEYCPRYLIGHKMRPHRVMRSVSTGSLEQSLPSEALLCCECGICELFACPMQLSPRRMNVHVKRLLREQGLGLEDKNIYPEQSQARSYRKVAQSRFTHRLQLSKYPSEIYEMVRCEPKQVCIALKHGVGRKSDPIVQVGDKVREGQLIAQVNFEDVGSMIHASIDGVVSKVDDNGICIAREGAEK